MTALGLVLHFILGALGSLLIFLRFTCASGATQFSAPSVVVLVGFLCASLAWFLSPWATPAILLIYGLASLIEQRRDERSALERSSPVDESHRVE